MKEGVERRMGVGWGKKNVVKRGKGGQEGGIKHIAPEQNCIYCSSTVVPPPPSKGLQLYTVGLQKPPVYCRFDCGQ